ncbi:MAG: carboxymuconolactone decarboxylase family protein [Holophaga sp.]|nr:carboxymuconolactone decarboxylase family protein [Holophaga sp.]
MATALEALRESLPDYAKDLKLNLQSLLSETSLTPAQRFGVALASAAAAREPNLVRALEAETLAEAGPETVEDALAANALMGMTNSFYRFRHWVGKESYAQLPARLRMNRVAKPAGSKVDFELFCLAVSAINACEACVRAHERTLIEAGLAEATIHDAIRIAATIHGLAAVLGLSSSSTEHP